MEYRVARKSRMVKQIMYAPMVAWAAFKALFFKAMSLSTLRFVVSQLHVHRSPSRHHCPTLKLLAPDLPVPEPHQGTPIPSDATS